MGQSPPAADGVENTQVTNRCLIAQLSPATLTEHVMDGATMCVTKSSRSAARCVSSI